MGIFLKKTPKSRTPGVPGRGFYINPSRRGPAVPGEGGKGGLRPLRGQGWKKASRGGPETPRSVESLQAAAALEREVVVSSVIWVF